MTSFLALDPEGITPEESRPAAEKVTMGDPIHRTWNLEKADGLYAGIWESTPGEWRVEYIEWEYCEILSGASVLIEEGGAERRVTAGDAFVLRPGFKGRWRVEETTRKRYVIRL
ncbi:cupin domain-containing protein [Aureimonas sp. N4]|uniref:cupin domain-containing protein n=1 Tax=Aureimonas sp. N4 TaxID=1638165 RepID=UPI0007810702|nr:cupin domain-containing protein [Aureimonas sp. N4]